MASTPAARERKLVEEGAKGVAGRRLQEGPGDGAAQGAQFRSAVRRIAGKPADKPVPRPDPEAQARKRATRAEQAAAGMLGPPPGTFDEAALKDWLKKMPQEDLAKLSRLVASARTGREEGRGAWSKVDRGMHVEVHGGTVNITTAPAQTPSQGAYSSRPRNGGDWGRHLARLKDFING